MNKVFLLLILGISLCGSAFSEEIEVKAYLDTKTGEIRYEGISYLAIQPPQEEDSGRIDPFKNPAEFWFNVIIAFSLTLFAGAMSGLTVGYLSIDDLIMELKLTTGSEEEKVYAKKILPVISNHHWLLVTLLLCNSFAMEALPIVLDKLVNAFMAVVISVTLILFFGEIIPQALCTGPNQLKLASALAPMTLFLMYITYPLSYPLGILIDHVVGKHLKSRFRNTDLKGLIELHTKEAIEKIKAEEKEDNQMNDEFGISKEQALIMKGAIDIQEKKVGDIMIPIKDTTMIEFEKPLDEETLGQLLEKGYSRIPVYSDQRNNVIGLLRMKRLIGKSPHGKSIKQLGLSLSKPIIVSPELHPMDLLDQFRKGKSHMAFVTNDVEKMQNKLGLDKENSYKESILPSKLILSSQSKDSVTLLGIITLEDVIEKMINIQILDEEDYKENQKENGKGPNALHHFKKAFTKKICASFIDEKKKAIHGLLEKGEANEKNNFDTPEENYHLMENC